MSRERRDSIIAKKQGGSTGITSGVSWDSVTEMLDMTLVTSATVYGTCVPLSAFTDQVGLTEVTYAGALTKINHYAFKGCVSYPIGALPETLETIVGQAFANCTSATKVWLPISCLTIHDFDGGNCSPFWGCDSGLTLYCEAASKPAGWNEIWNYYDETNQLTVVWGVSKAEFDALE